MDHTCDARIQVGVSPEVGVVTKISLCLGQIDVFPVFLELWVPFEQYCSWQMNSWCLNGTKMFTDHDLAGEVSH